MQEKDYIVRATAAGATVRAFAATTKHLVEYAKNAHDMSPVATAALGRLLTAGTMMGSMLKGEEDLLTLQIKGTGPIGQIVVTADSRATVKGYVHNPQVMLPPSKAGKLDVGGAVGPGFLTVIRDLGLKDPYVGTIDLQTGEIAEDLTYYFAVSEQIPSTVGLGVLMAKDNTVQQAGGFIIQLMPFAEEATIARLEKNLLQIPSVTTMLDSGMTPEKMLETLLEGLEMEIIDTIPTSFACNCSKARIEKALISIGPKDLKEMIDDGKPIEVKCQFCNHAYNFDIEELKKLRNP